MDDRNHVIRVEGSGPNAAYDGFLRRHDCAFLRCEVDGIGEHEGDIARQRNGPDVGPVLPQFDDRVRKRIEDLA